MFSKDANNKASVDLARYIYFAYEASQRKETRFVADVVKSVAQVEKSITLIEAGRVETSRLVKDYQHIVYSIHEITNGLSGYESFSRSSMIIDELIRNIKVTVEQGSSFLVTILSILKGEKELSNTYIDNINKEFVKLGISTSISEKMDKSELNHVIIETNKYLKDMIEARDNMINIRAELYDSFAKDGYIVNN